MLEKLADLKFILNPKALAVVALSCAAVLGMPSRLLELLVLDEVAPTIKPWAGGLLVLTNAGLFVHGVAWLARRVGSRRSRWRSRQYSYRGVYAAREDIAAAVVEYAEVEWVVTAPYSTPQLYPFRGPAFVTEDLEV